LLDYGIPREYEFPVGGHEANMNHEHEANYCRCDITDRVPADAAPDCEQRTRISRRAGENAFVNDMISLMLDSDAA
jgi:hypothetical protein